MTNVEQAMEKEHLDKSTENMELHILTTLFFLMQKKPYTSISITELCKEADISRTTFYTYFRDKEDLLEYLTTDFCIRYDDHKVSRYYLQYFEFWYHYRQWIELLKKNDLWEYICEKHSLQYSALLSPQDWERLLGDLAPKRELLFSFISGGLSKLIRHWHKNNFKETPEEMAQIAEFVLSGKMIK